MGGVNRSSKFYVQKLFYGSLSATAAEVGHKIVSFLLLPVFTYYLSPDDFGILAIIMVITTFLNLFYNPGIMTATGRLYWDTEI